jgi:hypothetical protein
VLINHESNIGAIVLTTLLHFTLLLSFAYHLFPTLVSTNHKCTQPCYFSLLLKPAAQKEKMDWNSSTRSSRLCTAPVVVPVLLWSLSLFRFVNTLCVYVWNN